MFPISVLKFTLLACSIFPPGVCLWRHAEILLTPADVQHAETGTVQLVPVHSCAKFSTLKTAENDDMTDISDDDTTSACRVLVARIRKLRLTDLETPHVLFSSSHRFTAISCLSENIWDVPKVKNFISCVSALLAGHHMKSGVFLQEDGPSLTRLHSTGHVRVSCCNLQYPLIPF